MRLRLRPVTAADETLLLTWANDPGVRSVARNTLPIAPEDHHIWFRRKLADPMCRIWIAELESEPVGQTRLDRVADTAEVDISVVRSARGKGVGQFMLSAPDMLHWPGLRRLRGVVRWQNIASLALFRGAGFHVARDDADFVEFEKEIGDVAAR
jgi:RimJ/RimL family protein N-acetyltransferase